MCYWRHPRLAYHNATEEIQMKINVFENVCDGKVPRSRVRTERSREENEDGKVSRRRMRCR